MIMGYIQILLNSSLITLILIYMIVGVQKNLRFNQLQSNQEEDERFKSQNHLVIVPEESMRESEESVDNRMDQLMVNSRNSYVNNSNKQFKYKNYWVKLAWLILLFNFIQWIVIGIIVYN